MPVTCEGILSWRCGVAVQRPGIRPTIGGRAARRRNSERTREGTGGPTTPLSLCRPATRSPGSRKTTSSITNQRPRSSQRSADMRKQGQFYHTRCERTKPSAPDYLICPSFGLEDSYREVGELEAAGSFRRYCELYFDSLLEPGRINKADRRRLTRRDTVDAGA